MHAEVIDAGYAPDGAAESPDFGWRLAAYGLLQGDTNAQAAARAGVDERTVYRWKRQPEFQALLTAAQKEVIADARTRLTSMVNGALDKLAKLRDDSSAKGAPTEASVCWGILDRAGVEVQETRAEGVRRIVSRLPAKQTEMTPPVAESDHRAILADMAQRNEQATRQPMRIGRGGNR